MAGSNPVPLFILPLRLVGPVCPYHSYQVVPGVQFLSTVLHTRVGTGVLPILTRWFVEGSIPSPCTGLAVVLNNCRFQSVGKLG